MAKDIARRAVGVNPLFLESYLLGIRTTNHGVNTPHSPLTCRAGAEYSEHIHLLRLINHHELVQSFDGHGLLRSIWPSDLHFLRFVSSETKGCNQFGLRQITPGR